MLTLGDHNCHHMRINKSRLLIVRLPRRTRQRLNATQSVSTVHLQCSHARIYAQSTQCVFICTTLSYDHSPFYSSHIGSLYTGEGEDGGAAPTAPRQRD